MRLRSLVVFDLLCWHHQPSCFNFRKIKKHQKFIHHWPKLRFELWRSQRIKSKRSKTWMPPPRPQSSTPPPAGQRRPYSTNKGDECCSKTCRIYYQFHNIKQKAAITEICTSLVFKTRVATFRHQLEPSFCSASGAPPGRLLQEAGAAG